MILRRRGRFFFAFIKYQTSGLFLVSEMLHDGVIASHQQIKYKRFGAEMSHIWIWRLEMRIAGLEN